MNTATHHSHQRIEERMADAGYDLDTITKVFAAAKALAKASTVKSEAIRLLKLNGQTNQAWGERSNGDELWAIIRDGRLVTVMLRRSTQPKTPEALKVQKVTVIGA